MKKRVLLIAPSLISVGLAVTLLPVESFTKAMLSWGEELGYWGYLVFFLTYALFTVLFIPGFILTVGTGAVFGLWIGFAVVSLRSTLGAGFTFWINAYNFLTIDLIVRENERESIKNLGGPWGIRAFILPSTVCLYPVRICVSKHIEPINLNSN